MMKKIPSLRSFTFALLALGGSPAFGASIMFDFGPTTVASPNLTLSPGHDAGTVTAGETSWNQVTSSAQQTSLNWSDGTSATGVTLTMGQGSKASESITYSTTATFTGSIAGNGGSAFVAGVTYEKLTTDKGTSIYGPATGSTTVSLDALFSSTSDTSIGFRIDGLAAGSYLVYAMVRNTNTNAPSGAGMNAYAAAGDSSSTFDFSSLTAMAQSNPGYARDPYVNEYGSFIAGENYVVTPIALTVGEDQSVFLSVEGQGAGGAGRGFINSLQIVAVPEPSVALLGIFGVFGLLRRRRA